MEREELNVVENQSATPETEAIVLPPIVEAPIVEPAPKKKHMGLSAKSKLANTFIYIVLVLMTIVWLFPFVCIIIESFRVESTAQVGYLFPKEWGFDNYITLFRDTDFPTWLLNTFVMGLATAVFQTIIVLCMSYTCLVCVSRVVSSS